MCSILRLNILPLEGRRVDPASELFVVKVGHAAVRIGRFQNHRAIDAFHFIEVRFRVNMSLKINDHNSAG